MCGILGYVGDFGAERLAAGLARIAHRGPDDAGTWFDDDRRVGLGHARLSILDLSPLGHQPMSDPDGRVVIAYNGEIYNFRELRAELETRGHRFRSRSDTEVLLHLYLEEGEAFLERLNGIFAFALWDARSRTLLLARDALGVKPLYVCAGPLGVAFASEIKGLLELVPDARALDVASLHRYLTFLWCPGEGTPLRDVRKLAPGEVVRVRDGRIEGRRTWYRLPAFAGRAADLDEPDAVAGSLAQLRAAVHRQMVADVPVGAFLSGGLDSSAVVALAREVHPEIRCFTIEIEGGQEAGTADDLPYATRVAKHLGVSLERVRIDAGRMADDLEFMVAQLDEPLADPAPLNVFYISRLAREHGMKVLLSGAGGDDLFTGYRRHVALRYESAWTWLPRGARAALDRMASRLDQRNPWFRRAAKLFRDAHLDGDDRLVGAFAWARDAELRSLWTPDAAREIDGTRAGEPMLEFLRPMPASVPDLEFMVAQLDEPLADPAPLNVFYISRLAREHGSNSAGGSASGC